MPRRTPIQEAQMLAGLNETAEPLVEMDADQEHLYNELFSYASNYGDFYRKKDAKGAVEYAFKEYMRTLDGTTRADFKVIKSKLVKDLAKRWKTKAEDVDEALASMSPDEIEARLDALGRELDSARSSLNKLMRDPKKYAPQRGNVMHHLKQISNMARSVIVREK